MMFGAPLLLGSVYGLIIAAVGSLIIAGRIIGEEKMLLEELEGYEAYQKKVKPSECEWVWSQSKLNLWDDQVIDLTAGPGFSDPPFERYIDSMIRRHLLVKRATRFESKNPVNALRIGYLHKLFPDARFINQPVEKVRGVGEWNNKLSNS